MQPSGNAYLDQYRSSNDYATPFARPTASHQGGLGGFLVDNLPTIGGVLGGIVGLPLNALDAVTGVGGTALDAGLGAAGSAAGEALKEKLQGGKINAGDVAAQGAIGGLGAGAGRLLGGIAGKVMPKLASDGAAPVTDALNNFSNKKIAGQMAENLPANTLKTGKDVGRLYENADLARNLGLYSNGDRQAAANVVTGENGFVNQLKQSVLQNSGRVPLLDNIDKTISNALTENGVAGAAEQKAIRNAASAQVQKAVGTGGSIGSMATDASAAFKAQQALEKLGQAAATAGKAEQAGAYRQIAKSIGDAIDAHAGTNEAISNLQLSPTMVDQLTTRATQALGKNKGQALASYVTDAVNNAKTLPELRAIEAQFIPGSKAATAAEISGLRGVGGETGSVVGNAAGAAVSPFGRLSLARQLVSKVAGPEAALAGKAAAITGKIEPKIAPALSQIAGQNVVRGMVPAAVSGATAPDQNQPTDATLAGAGGTGMDTTGASTGLGSGTTGSSTGGSGSASDSSFFSPQVLQALAIRDIEETGGKNLAQIKTLNDLFGPGSSSSKSNTVKPTSQQLGEAQSGSESLAAMERQISQNPGVVNQTAIPGQNLPVVGGLIRNLAGTGDYQAAGQNTLDALARARTGAAMSKSEQAFYNRMLPQPGDSSETVQFKLQQLQDAFAPYMSAQSLQ